MFSSPSSTRGLVDKATADDDAPTPGYLYNDLAKATFKSLKDCQVVEDQLLTRLTKNVPPAVKLKCLRVAKHCVLKGEISFKRDLQRRLGPIRACLECRGPPDPIHGDALYRQIRDEAQELMNAIFDTEDKARPRMEGTEGAGAPASPGAPRTMGGFGGHHSESDSSSSSASSASARITELFSSFKGSSSSSSGSGSGGAGQGGDASFSRQPGAFPSAAAEAIEGGGVGADGRKYMAGMGNTDYDPHRHASTKREEGLVAKLLRAGDAMVSGGPAAPTSNLSRGAFQGSYHSPALPRPSAGGTAGGYVPGVSPAASSSSSSSATSGWPGSGSESHAARDAGEGLAGAVSENIWERSDREWRATEASSPERAKSHAGDRPQGATGARSGDGTESDGDVDSGEEDKGGDEYVEQLVNEIALPGGVRVAPPASVLAQFCLRCESLSGQQRVAAYRLLHAKLLDHQSPPVQQRVLHVVAGLVKRRVAGAEAFFAAHDQPLRALAASPVPAARTKAAEIVEVLRVPTAAGGRAPSADHRNDDDAAGSGGWGRLPEEGALDEPLALPPAAISSPTSSLFVGLSVNDDDSTGHHHHHQQQQQAAGSRASLLGDDPFDAFLAPLAATHAEAAPPRSPLFMPGGGGDGGQASPVEHQLHGLSLGGSSLLPSTSSFVSPPSAAAAAAPSGPGRAPSSAAHPHSLLSYPTPSTTTTTTTLSSSTVSSSASTSSSSFDSAFPFMDGPALSTRAADSPLPAAPLGVSAPMLGSYGAPYPAFGSGGMAYVAVPPGMMALYAPTGSIAYAAPPPATFGPSATSHVAGGSGGHGFSFMQGSGAASTNEAEDSFSFVKDEMKAKAAAGKK